MFIKRLGTFFFDVLEVIVFAVGLFFFIYLLVLRPHKIKGASMMPNFPDGEYVLTERVSYYAESPKRGDVVVFKPPVSEDEYIKRVIGLPGETIALKNGKVLINDQLLDEKYLSSDMITEGSAFLANGQGYALKEGEFFVMGDNRPHSYDSRSWGPIKKSDTTGRAWIIYWPITNIGLVRQ